jgi:two-component system alkaline phosphatase synthesis response regulator PhoP
MQDGKHVILCVDDDQDLLDALRMVLEANGYMMVEARSGEEGLKKYKESKPDLIIVDLMMEEVDAGTSLVRDLKAAGASQPIFMLSSVGDNLNLSTDYTDLGLSGVFQKPIDNQSLINVIQSKLK